MAYAATTVKEITERTYLHLTIDSIAISDPASRTTVHAVITPAGTLLSVGAIPRHVARVAANATDDAGRVILAFRAVVLAMSYLTAVLTSLVFVITQGTVQRCEFTKLVTLQLVLAFRDRRSLYEKC